MSKYTLEELAIDHPYYCNENNYYSNDAAEDWDTMSDFLNAYEDADEDLNLCFRWDIKRRDNGTYRAEVFMMMQRKGKFTPHSIRSVNESEVERFVLYAERHWRVMNALWQPLSIGGES